MHCIENEDNFKANQAATYQTMIRQERSSCMKQAHPSAPERSMMNQTQTRRQLEAFSNQSTQLIVERDFIESFLAFANYLDSVNPICAPECIDTVDKLLSTLSQRF